MQEIEGEVIVVDNHSADGSAELVAKKFPQFRLIANKENVGYSKANNQAIKEAKGNYYLLLNPDTVVEKDCFQKVIAFMDSYPDAGGLGVKMVDGKGNFLPESKRAFPTASVSLYKVLRLHQFFPKSKVFDRYYLGYLSPDEVHEVDILVGAFMLLRAEALEKTGLLDEQFFMFWEDTDLSYRLQKAGYKNYYFPLTRIIHYKGESTRKDTPAYIGVFYGAMERFVLKHFPKQPLYLWSVKLIRWALTGFVFLRNLVTSIALPIADVIVLLIGMFLLVNFWELNYKFQKDYFPPEFKLVAVPLYILVWILSVYVNGGYDRPFKLYRIGRGILLGTLLISAASNFVEDIRFSRAMIVLGGLYAMVALFSTRWLSGLIARKWRSDDAPSIKKIIIVGEKSETDRVAGLIKQAGIESHYLGYISPGLVESQDHQYLGPVERIDDLLDIYRPGEVIFCLNSIPVNQVIELMSRNAAKVNEFKIVPQGSDYAIGSNSSKSRGEIYAINIKLSILEPASIRNKRLIDVLISTLLLLISPFSWLFIRHPRRLWNNTLMVLSGRWTWVGYAYQQHTELPELKPGVIHPALRKGNNSTLDDETQRRLDFLYARDYHVGQDLQLIFQNLRRLDLQPMHSA